MSVGAWTLGGRDMAQGNPLFLAERASVSQWQGEVATGCGEASH